MSTQNIADLNPRRGEVIVDGSWVQLSLRINDEEGAALLVSKKTDDARLDAAETALRIGLSSLASADYAHTDRLLDEKLGTIVERLSRAADESFRKACDSFEERWKVRVEQELGTRLDAHRRNVEEQLDKLFGDSSDRSVHERMRRLMADYSATVKKELETDHASIRKELTELVNGTGNPDHPLAKIDGKLTEIRKDLAVELEAQRAAVSGQVARQSTGQAGYDYQDDVYAAVAETLKVTDDEVEFKGRSPGATGGAEGDVVVTVSPALTGGVSARISVEATKASAVLNTAKVKAMLAKGRDDRAAQAAVLVLRSSKVIGGQRLMTYPGLGVVVVYEPDDPEEFRTLALAVGMKQAKAMAIREVKPSAAARNDEAIERATQEAKDAIDVVDAIIGNQTKIIKLAEGTCASAKDVRRRVLDAMTDIDDALASST